MPFFLFSLLHLLVLYLKKKMERKMLVGFSNILSIFCVFLIENKEGKVVEGLECLGDFL